MATLNRAELDSVAAKMAEAGTTPARPLECELIAGGRSNLTYRLTDGTDEWVLRMPPRAGRTPTAHDVAREYRVTSALATSGVPVPPAVALCEDESVIGLPFSVAGYVAGRTIQARADLATLDDGTLGGTVTSLVEALAALHNVDYVAVGLGQFGRPDGFAARQVRRWARQWDIVGDPCLAPLANALRDRLDSTSFDQRSTGIVHGDYRIDNTILTYGRDATVKAIVDWELSTIGDPVADVAMMCVYRDPALDLVLGVPSAWASERMPETTELAAAYQAAGGVDLVDWEAHLALGYFKLAVIAAGIHHRHRAGATPGAGFDSAGDAVAPLLEQGLAALPAPA